MYLHDERAITLLVRRVRDDVRVASITQMVRAACDVEDEIPIDPTDAPVE